MTPHPTRRRALGAAALSIALLFPITRASAETDEAPLDVDTGREAVAELGSELPEVADGYGLTSRELRNELLEDPTLAVDAQGELLYVDELPPFEEAEAGPDDVGAGAPPTTDPVFSLHSRPGADHTVHLDFDGHTTSGTSWNTGSGLDPIVSPPYDLDGSPDTWSSTELARIAAVFERVAEDFRPFDLDVTTEDPGPEALRRSGGGDTEWGIRVVVTDDTWAGCGCGGHAYIGSFDDGADEPVFVYNSSLAGVAEASSHEVGHAMLLSHDGTSSSTYYGGHGTGATGWAPLMGASYYRAVTQWSRGDYHDANNGGASANYGNGPDHLALIADLTNGNGFGYRPDDHGGDLGAATGLPGPELAATGVIERTTDVDLFSFTIGAGPVTIDVTPVQAGNLDVHARLLDDRGAPVAESDEPNRLVAGITETLPAGTYHLAVDGTGTGTPGADPPSGYSEYGSLGQYQVTGTVPGPDVPPVDPELVVVREVAPAAVRIGEAVDHTITLDNTGPVALTGLSVTDPGAPDCDRTIGSLPDLAPGHRLVVTCSFTPTTTDHLGAYGTVASVDGEPLPAPVTSNEVVVEVSLPPHPFVDVPAWAAEAVDWISWDPDADGPLAPIATGFGREFRPRDPINRAQLVRMLHRLAGAPPTSADHPFTDVPSWVDPAVDWAWSEGIVTGFADRYRPLEGANRAQVARMLLRLDLRLELVGYSPPA